MLPRIRVRHEKVSTKTRDRIVWSCGKLEKYCNKLVDCEFIIDKDKRGIEQNLLSAFLSIG